jgi:hypothetical protein
MDGMAEVGRLGDDEAVEALAAAFIAALPLVPQSDVADNALHRSMLAMVRHLGEAGIFLCGETNTPA